MSKDVFDNAPVVGMDFLFAAEGYVSDELIRYVRANWSRPDVDGILDLSVSQNLAEKIMEIDPGAAENIRRDPALGWVFDIDTKDTGNLRHTLTMFGVALEDWQNDLDRSAEEQLAQQRDANEATATAEGISDEQDSSPAHTGCTITNAEYSPDGYANKGTIQFPVCK